MKQYLISEEEREYLKCHSDSKGFALLDRLKPITPLTVERDALKAEIAAMRGQEPVSQWMPIESAPKGEFILVYEDGAMRAVLSMNDGFRNPGYPALVTKLWGDVIVGQDAKRILDPLGYQLKLRDGCCENPTHWMPPPAAPGAQPWLA